MRVGQLLLQCLNLLAVLADFTVKLLEVFVDLMRVVAPRITRANSRGVVSSKKLLS